MIALIAGVTVSRLPQQASVACLFKKYLPTLYRNKQILI